MTARWIDIDGPSAAHVLSYSSAKVLVTKSAHHARLRKLRELPDDTSDEMDLGNVVHALLLGKGRGFAVAEYVDGSADAQLAASVDAYEETGEMPPEAPGDEPAPRAKGRKRKPPEPPPLGPDGKPEWQDWKRGDARACRGAIRARGLVPILPKVRRMAEAGAKKLRTVLDGFGITFDGVSEPGITWREFADDGSEVTCVGALDHWHARTATIYDLKIVDSAHPEAIKKYIPAYGCDIQAAAYTSAIETMHPELAGRARFVFLFCELAAAVVTPVTLAGSMAHLGRSRWRRAVNTWARCLATNTWPAYVDGPIAVEAPEWLIAAEMAHAIDTNELARYVNAAPIQRDDEQDEGSDDDERDERQETPADIF